MFLPVPCSALSDPSYRSTMSDVVHEVAVALDLLAAIEVLREDKVKIPSRAVEDMVSGYRAVEQLLSSSAASARRSTGNATSR